MAFGLLFGNLKVCTLLLFWCYSEVMIACSCLFCIKLRKCDCHWQWPIPTCPSNQSDQWLIVIVLVYYQWQHIGCNSRRFVAYICKSHHLLYCFEALFKLLASISLKLRVSTHICLQRFVTCSFVWCISLLISSVSQPTHKSQLISVVGFCSQVAFAVSTLKP